MGAGDIFLCRTRRRRALLPVASVASAILSLLLVACLAPSSLSIREARSFSSSATSAQGPARALYIVHLRSAPPIVSYRGGIPGFPPIAPPQPSDSGSETGDEEGGDTGGDPSGNAGGAGGAGGTAGSGGAGGAGGAAGAARAAGAGSAHGVTASANGGKRRQWRVNPRLPHVRAFKRMLQRQQRLVAAHVGLRAEQLLYSYAFAGNSFAALLSPQQVWRLSRHPAVAAVRGSAEVRALTTATPAFLQLPQSLWAAAGGEGSAGEGVVVGVVDTGIWPEHRSFANDSSAPYGPPPSSFKGACPTSSDFPATACSGKLVGGGSFRAALEAGGTRIDWTREYASPRDAVGHGTWCAGAAAGNGNTAAQVSATQSLGRASGMAPRARIAMYKVLWRVAGGYGSGNYADLFAAVDQAVSDGVDVLSLSLGGYNPSATYFDDLPFLRAFEAGIVVVFAAGNAGAPSFARTVYNFSPYYITVGASTISRSVTYSGVSFAKASSHASALTLATVTPSTLTPTLNTSTATTTTTTTTTTNPNASPSPSASASAVPPNSTTSAPAPPYVADFSSTGPLSLSSRPRNGRPTNDILKPDIIAPGVNLWAAAPAAPRLASPPTSLFAQLSGTSMATPHIAGIAALLIQRNPSWSVGQIMSAITTTARVTSSNGRPIQNWAGRRASPWQMGAGHVDPQRLLDPGLTYDLRAADFRNFLAGQNMGLAAAAYPGERLYPIQAARLNRPSISVTRFSGFVTVRRRVTNVAAKASTYRAVVKSPPLVYTKVTPQRFRILPGHSVSFSVTFFSPPGLTFNRFLYGSLTWKDERGHSVRSPIVLRTTLFR